MIRSLTIFLLFAASLAKGDSEADRLTAAGIGVFTNAYRSWSEPLFRQSVSLFREACEKPSASATNFYWLGAGEFHYALELLGSPVAITNKEVANSELDAAVKALTSAVQIDVNQCESHALLGTIYGMKISENWLRAVWLGPCVQKELKLARAQGTNNARVEYLLGTSQFFCAGSDFSRREALKTLLNAEKLFDVEVKTPSAPLAPRWGHDSCLTFIGSCYEKLGQPTEAETYFQKALRLHPENGLAEAGLVRLKKNKK